MNQPLYRQVAHRLIEDIASGHYPVGSLLPPEAELGRIYGAGRHTVREAVRHVQSLGMLVRRQGHGTRIKSAQQRPRYTLSINTFDDIEQHGYFTHLVEVESEEVVADAALARDLPCGEGERFLRMRCYRVPVDESIPIPVAWNETFIVERYAGVREEIVGLDGPVYGLIERRFGERICEIRQEVGAVRLDRVTARKLSARRDAIGLKVKRAYVGREGKPIMFGFNTYQADDFRIVMRLLHDPS